MDITAKELAELTGIEGRIDRHSQQITNLATYVAKQERVVDEKLMELAKQIVALAELHSLVFRRLLVLEQKGQKKSSKTKAPARGKKPGQLKQSK